MKSLQTIDKRTNLFHKDFINEFLIPDIPVVVTDAAKKWKAKANLILLFLNANN